MSKTVKKKKKNKKKGERELSAGTIVLLCVALVAAAVAVFFVIKAMSPKEPTPTLPPTPQTTVSSVGTTSVPETETPAETGETTAETTETAVEAPTPTETAETPTATVETTETPTVEPPPTDTEGTYLEVPAEEDKRKDEVEVDGAVVKIGYFLPKIHAENEDVEAKINGVVRKAVQRAVDRLTDNINNNFDPIVMEPEDKEIGISFFKSEHTVSVILRYELISGSGETVYEAYGVNFDAAGNAIGIDGVLTDRPAAADYVKINADAGDEPDFSILEDGNAFCSAWYIDGEKLTLLYNGRTLDRLYPFVITVEFPAPTMYNV